MVLDRVAALMSRPRAVLGGLRYRFDRTPPAPDPTGFYAAHDPGPGPRGEVLGAEPLPASWLGYAWRVRYRTLDAAGQPIAASMALAVPADLPSRPRPVVVWVHGAVGVAPGCGPSRTGFDAWYARELLDAGVVVAAPDLTGLGMEGRHHPYLHGTTAGRSILDAARAAVGLTAAGAGNVVALAGHSAGGYAVLRANELAAGDDGAGIDVRLAVPMSALDDLAAAMRWYGTRRSLGVYAVQLAATWPTVEHVDAGVVLTPSARARLEHLSSDRLPRLARVFGGDPTRWIDSSGWETPAWAGALERESAGRARGAAHVLLVHGDADVPVPLAWAEALAERIGEHGELVVCPGADHMGVHDAARELVVGRLLAAVDRA